MSGSLRLKLACHPCTVRKIKCNKHIPCDNCVKRGEDALCRRQADYENGNAITDGLVEYQQTKLLSDPHIPVSFARHARLVESLQWRVESLERALRDHLQSGDVDKFYGIPEVAPVSQHTLPSPVILHPMENSNDTVGAVPVEGGSRGHASTQNMTSSWSDADRLFKSNNDGGLTMLQGLLPSRSRIDQMVDYHINYLLWMHNAIHAITFRRELRNFYDTHDEEIHVPSPNNDDNCMIQWIALLFAILSGSMISAPDHIVASWGYQRSEQQVIAERWHNATIRCLELSQYLFNQSIFSIQAIATLTSSGYALGFMRSQCVLMATGIRIAQGLGLHQLAGHYARERETYTVEQLIARETKRRVWYTLVRQDYFFIPFSESYQVHRLFNNTTKPINCKEEDMSPLNDEVPTITTYCRFLDEVALIMSELHDALKTSNTLYAQYEETLRFDAKMRALATLRRPYCFANVPSDPLWPMYATWGRMNLTISSSHKIIMIHRKFLGRSFTDSAFAFTRKTCIAAAKTILKALFENYDVGLGALNVEDQGRPVIWTEQAFSVTACVILCFDILYRPPGETECLEHRALVEKTILKFRGLDQYVIARKGIRLLRALLAEGLGGYAATIDRKRRRTEVSHQPDDGNGMSINPSASSTTTRTLKFVDIEKFIQRFWISHRAANPNYQQGKKPHSTPSSLLSLEDFGNPNPASDNVGMYRADNNNQSDNYMFQGLFGEDLNDPLGGMTAAMKNPAAMYWPCSSMCIDVEEPATLLIPPDTRPSSTPSFEDLLFRAENFDF